MSTEEATAKQLDSSAGVGEPVQSPLAPAHVVAGYKTVRSQVLVWCGILGGVLTVFSNIGKVLTLSDWAHWLVSHWHDWTNWFWTFLFSWIAIKFPPELASPFSFLAFLLMLSVGTIWQAKTATQGQQSPRHIHQPVRKFLIGIGILIIYFHLFVDLYGDGVRMGTFFKHIFYVVLDAAHGMPPWIGIPLITGSFILLFTL